MTQADPAVETFVRGTLGCGCPDEVFQQVEESALAAPEAPAAWRIAIGGRLLVYLWQPARGASIAAGVAALMRAGRSERDTQGFNRLRLVVAGPSPTDLAAPATAAFEAASAGDGRAHLHVLASAELPRPLAGPEPADRVPGSRVPTAAQGSPST